MSSQNEQERDSERGIKWWVRVAIIPVIVALIYLLATRIDDNGTSPGSPTPVPPTPTPVTVTWGGITWRHNPGLPSPQGYPGDRSYDPKNYENTEWVKAIPLSATSDEILLIHGQYANIPDAPEFGTIGNPNGCFLLITRGPLNTTIDLKTATVETHQADLEANTLTWAAQKVADMRTATEATCGKGVDLWVGK